MKAGGFTDLVRIAGLDPTKAFRHGDLRRCDLRDQNLAKFDFTGAVFTGAHLEGADLSAAVGLDTAIGLDQATFDLSTKWPRPSWADAAGRDAFGPWASFTVAGK
ncbi:MAG: pentapeptide repeat-containing protein, partial [Acetobacteraceae bacterium]